MTIRKQNQTQQRQLPQSLSQALLSFSTGDLGLPVRSLPNSRRDLKDQRSFLQSILEQAIEIANGVDDCFSEDSSSNNTDNEEDENSRSLNRNQ
jgi:hypothetical protein